ncbi:MAG: hypothetical protein ABEI74_03970 [Candidatus Pacearchaeota archaeon]
MERGDIEALDKNIEILEKEVKNLEEAFDKNNKDDFKESREKMFRAQSKISKELE